MKAVARAVTMGAWLLFASHQTWMTMYDCSVTHCAVTALVAVVLAYLAAYAYVSRSVVLTHDKTMYAVSNLVKAFALAVYTPLALMTVWTIWRRDVWDTERIRRLSVLYAVPDFVSMLCVRRMGKPTIVHHTFVVLFAMVSIHNDYAVDNACRGIVVYACFSTFAYSVNAVLGMRFIDPNHAYAALLSATVYAICLVVNWTYQVWFVASRIFTTPASMCVYACSLGLIVYDDVILMSWLARNAQASLRAEASGSQRSL